MAYKFLGQAVWRGARWYLRRRYPKLGRNLVVAGIVGLLVAGGGAALAAQRRPQND